MPGACSYLRVPATTGTNMTMREGEWGDKRKRVLAVLVDGDLGGKTVRQVAVATGVAPQYVYKIVREEAERREAEGQLPKDGPLPDNLPMKAVKHMMPARAWTALMNYGWVFKEDAPLAVLRGTPDDVLLALPQMGEKAIAIIRQTFGYGDAYPTTARKLFS
jgi:hypothetical protein